MRKRFVVIAGLLIISLLFVFAGSITADHRQETVVRVHASQDPGTPVVVNAAAWLQTDDNGANMKIRTSSLTPGHAVTLWLVVVNNPSACASSPCSGADILGNTAAVEAQVTYGHGKVVGANGKVNLASRLNAGAVPNGWFPGQDFTHPTTAEVHLVINDHGPVIPELMPEMIRTYRAGCTDESLPPPFPPTAIADGTPGPNTCRLVQSAIFVQE